MSEPDKPKLDKSKFTARNVAKYVVKATVQLNVTRIAKNALVDYVGLDSDGVPVKIGAHVIGWGASDALKPYTDKMVDKTADYAAKKLAERRQKIAAQQAKPDPQ